MVNYGYSNQPPSSYGYEEYGHPVHREPPREPPRETRDPYVSAAAPSQGGGPNYRWWIPGDGIRRDVIQADIQRYLGPEAVVRPGPGRDENSGRNGYWIAAYRTFTPEMIKDLKADSANFEHSGDRGTPFSDKFGFGPSNSPDSCIGAYQDSMIHRSRQHWGPTEPDRNVPSRASDATSSYTQSSASSAYQGTQGYPPSYPPQQQDSYPATHNYTHERGDPNASSSSHYAYSAQPESGYGSRTAGAYHEPRSQAAAQSPYVQSQAPSQSSYSHPRQQTTTHPSAVSGPRPGYYLASDGNYYPNASRPT